MEEGRREDGGFSMNYFEIIPKRSNLVTNGSTDYHGRTADKTRTGGWKASPFIIINEVAERLSFFSVSVCMSTYLEEEMHEPLARTTSIVSYWKGASYVLALLGAFLADAYLGKFKTIVVFSSLYAMGTSLLTASATLDGLSPLPGLPATKKQELVLYAALSLIALGTGGIKPCISPFGADQFDENDERESKMKSSFFNWFFFAINMGAAIALTVMAYIQNKYGWGLGFGIPAASTVLSLLVLVAGTKMYRYKKPLGSPITRFAQVLVAACRNHSKTVQEARFLYEVKTEESEIVGARKLPHTEQYRFLDKAALVVTGQEDMTGRTTSRWRLCTVTQVEEFKSFIRVLPIWAVSLALPMSFAQIPTFFIKQANIMDRRFVFNFIIPPQSMSLFTVMNPVLLIPLYEAYAVPLLRKFTGHPRGINTLQRMGTGFFFGIFALLAAALIEKRRRESENPMSVHCFWLIPQYFLLGFAEMFIYMGALEFYYSEATDGTRSLSSALFLTEIGIGSWLNGGLVSSLEDMTGGKKKGWIRSDLNESKLDYFYWIVCGFNVVSFLLYIPIAMAYKGKDDVAPTTVTDQPAAYDED